MDGRHNRNMKDLNGPRFYHHVSICIGYSGSGQAIAHNSYLYLLCVDIIVLGIQAVVRQLHRIVAYHRSLR